MTRLNLIVFNAILGVAALSTAAGTPSGSDDPPADRQPKVQPGASEPDWSAILDEIYGLDMKDDLANPVRSDRIKVPGRFVKAGAGPVRFVPEIALGLEVVIRGGYYQAGDPKAPEFRELWSYQYKNRTEDVDAVRGVNPPLSEGSTVEFDPGDSPFGLYIGNDQFHDQVATEPAVVASISPRLAAQPYKAMIYPYRDPESGKIVPDSYLIGWEYSTNDDFQDVVCRVENVKLLDADE